MNQLNVKSFALASGLTGSVVYLACFVVMSIFPKDVLIQMGNLLFHGVDFTEDLRMGIPITETLLGIVASFVVWGVVGLVFATFYNKLKV